MAAGGARPPVIRIANGTLYRHQPRAPASRPNPPLFANLLFELAASSPVPRSWCVVGPSLSGKSTFLDILRGRLLCDPPTARSFPHLSQHGLQSRLRSPQTAVRYVGFAAELSGGGGGAGSPAYLSARYESRREIDDFTLRDFLLGNTELNPLEVPEEERASATCLLDRVVEDLGLSRLLHLPVTFLSNGQGRRARIARALLARPEVVLLDEPFMGLDPRTVASLSRVLGSLAAKESPRLVLSARPQDPLPEWITHLVYLRKDCQVESMGPKEAVLDGLRKYVAGVKQGGLVEDERLPLDSLVQLEQTRSSTGPVALADASKTTVEQTGTAVASAEPLVEFDGCQVRYGDKVALGDWSQQTPHGQRDGLVWRVKRGERWGVFGPNGSGKTTIVSLLSSDHPQTYSLPIRLFGRSRLPDPASGLLPLTFWDIQSRIGHSSPEVHQHMPRSHSIRQVVENAWAPTFGTKARLDKAAELKVEAALRWFEPELRPSSSPAMPDSDAGLGWADECVLGQASFSAQRVALFLRAVIRSPDVVVLDEAFSGMDEAVRDKCMRFLAHGETETRHAGRAADGAPTAALGGLTSRQALICIAHVREEVPDCVGDWLCLPEPNTGRAARFGRLAAPLKGDEAAWREIWGFGGA